MPEAPLLDLDDAALADVVGTPAYRVRQVKRWLYESCVEDAAEMTDLPRDLRTRLSAVGVSPLARVAEVAGDHGATVKWLFESRGAQIETVLMQYPRRATVCVSSQAGCAMACPFCATGQEGFQRQLSVGEVVGQVLAAQRFLRSGPAQAQRAGPDHVTNVVFMGMGEPLANYETLVASLNRLNHDLGISARSMTVSTIGIPERIRALAGDVGQVTLAWSLHAPDDAQRDVLVPANRRWPISSVLEAIADYRAAGGRRVTVEYTLIAGVNDTPAHARRLASLVAGRGMHVNCISLNPTGDTAWRPTSPDAARSFVASLVRGGVNATLRQSRGQGIDGACGQLRSRRAGAAAT